MSEPKGAAREIPVPDAAQFRPLVYRLLINCLR